MNNMFIDYDGTLVSNKRRLFRFFVENLPETMKSIITEDEFWNLKLLGIHEIDWVNNHFGLGIDKEIWDIRKKNNIEEEYYLNFNEIFHFSIPTLQYLQQDYELYLVTRRSNKRNLFREVQRNNMSKYFKDIIVVPHTNNICKSKYIEDSISVSPNDIFVGDTEDDMKAGLKLGVKTYFVRSGIRSDWILRKYFIDKITEIKRVDNISCICS